MCWIPLSSGRLWRGPGPVLQGRLLFPGSQTAPEKGWKTSSPLKPKVSLLEPNPLVSVGHLAKGKMDHLLNTENK